MKKAFDQNVSRAKPRLRLGAQIMETADTAAAELSPPAPVLQDSPVPEPLSAALRPVMQTPVPQMSHAPQARVEETVVYPAELSSQEALGSEVKSRVERSRQARPAAAEALLNALETPLEVSTVRAEPPPRVVEDVPMELPQARRQNVQAPAARREEPPEVASPPTTREELDPAERRERLKERLKTVRENPRPEPLPPTVAQAGVLAVERIATLQTELFKIKALNLALTQDLEAARRQAEKSTEEARARMDEARRLSGETEARSKLLSELERELAVLEGERDEALLSLQDARQSLMLAEQEKEGLRKEIAQREQALADSLTEEERLAEELELMQSDSSGLRKSLEALNAERDMLARQVADLTTERAELLEARRALESVHRALSQAVSR